MPRPRPGPRTQNWSLTTSNMTGRHRGLKWKLRAGYRVPSWHRSAMSVIVLSIGRRWLECTSYVSLSIVLSHTFSALRVYLTFGHHPHPLDYLSAKFRFCGDLRCWASPWTKIVYSINHSVTHSLTQLIWCPGTQISKN